MKLKTKCKKEINEGLTRITKLLTKQQQAHTHTCTASLVRTMLLHQDSVWSPQGQCFMQGSLRSNKNIHTPRQGGNTAVRQPISCQAQVFERALILWEEKFFVLCCKYTRPDSQSKNVMCVCVCLCTCERTPARCCSGRKSAALLRTADRSRSVIHPRGRVFNTSSNPVEPRALWERHTDLRWPVPERSKDIQFT